ncbi:hypothetical protein [uncultured Algibacter sp.]|uniref:hypothetical protein n=1 Tax=uncultured Algibacter sp. TaxID=298659 RepID=UPI003216A997
MRVLLSQELIDKGIKTGSFTIADIELEGKNNLLTLYIIFDKAFNAEVIAKAFDKNNLEIGRSKINIEGSVGEAKYFDFEFDKRTYIGVRNKIMIE